jgi:F-type H+-transporting ATPase subunit delta
MINKSRGEVLYATAREFVNQYNVIKHIVKATVISATPLSAENKKSIVKELEASVGGNIALQTQVDPALIGGFVLKVGDLQVDTSISNSLAKLKKEFSQRVIQ